MALKDLGAHFSLSIQGKSTECSCHLRTTFVLSVIEEVLDEDLSKTIQFHSYSNTYSQFAV